MTVTLSRRRLLGGMAATALTGIARSGAAGPLEDVLALPAVDMHSHASSALSSLYPQSNLGQRMRQGRFAVVTLVSTADQPVIQRVQGGPSRAVRQPRPGELFAHVERQLGLIDALIKERELARILKPDDVAADRPGILIGVEGADFLEGKIERVQWAHERGVRHLQLVHYRVNELGDIMTEEPVHKGLTDFGAEVVRECNRLGIIIDVAHASAAMNFKVVELSKTPLVLSHGGVTMQEPRRGSRMITADQAKAIVAKGGIIGLWPAGAMFRNIDVWAGGLANMAKNWGVDAVAIGTDMGGGIEEVFNDYGAYPKVVEALLSKGLSVENVAKIVGGNHMRVFKAVAAAATA